MAHSHADIDKHVKVYVTVFVSLMVLTVVTVAAWKFLEVSVPVGIAVALFIAAIKGTLVACFFMHLISEKRLILWVLILTVIFFFALLLLPVWTSLSDQVAS